MEGQNFNLLFIKKPYMFSYIYYKIMLIWSFYSRIWNKSTDCANQKTYVILWISDYFSCYFELNILAAKMLLFS